jgi:hypothetical protein
MPIKLPTSHPYAGPTFKKESNAPLKLGKRSIKVAHASQPSLVSVANPLRLGSSPKKHTLQQRTIKQATH